MKILFASDSFKGSLTSERIIQLLSEAVRQVFPGAETEGMLVADGGEGTMDTVVKELHGVFREIEVKGPLLEPAQARYGFLPGSRAVVEMAAASGLPMVPAEKRNPLKTTSFGTGMLIRDALDQGCREIAVALGGSATNDGGMGAMSALGVRFYDKDGNSLAGTGEELRQVAKVDISNLHPAVKETAFTVMCDVTNPLLGKDGATYTFGPQKGADLTMLETLEAGMTHYAKVVEDALGVKVSEKAGVGAAGGLGFALTAFLTAELKSGIETVLDMIHFDEKLQGANLVITGEGRMDWQSSFGKVPSGVSRRCKRAGIPAVAIVGGLLDGYQGIYDAGISSVITTINGAMTLEEAVTYSEKLYLDAAIRLLRAIQCGMNMK